MKWIQEIFFRPLLCLKISALIVFLSLAADGSLIEVFRGGRSLRVLKNRAQLMREKNSALKEKIEQSRSLNVIEKEARDRLDFAGKDDLIFIFPQDI